MADGDQLLSRTLDPGHILGQEEGRGTDAKRGGGHARRRRAVVSQGDGGVRQALSDPDDPRIGPAEALPRAIDDGPLTLGDRLVLRALLAGCGKELTGCCSNKVQMLCGARRSHASRALRALTCDRGRVAPVL